MKKVKIFIRGIRLKRLLQKSIECLDKAAENFEDDNYQYWWNLHVKYFDKYKVLFFKQIKDLSQQ